MKIPFMNKIFLIREGGGLWGRPNQTGGRKKGGIE